MSAPPENKKQSVTAFRIEQLRLAGASSGVVPRPIASILDQPIEYIDTAPQPFEVQIPLYEYFERIKRHKADRWQKNFCDRLQDAAVGRHDARTWAIIHAEAQLGKSTILAQTLPAWLLGHQPLTRIALATYNVTRSQSHSKVVLGILELPIHKAIFPNADGLVKNNAPATGWMTNARTELNDGQMSFNPVGLQSGLTGSGFDWLIIDDPYASQKEAFSSTVRTNLQEFWDFTVMSRIGTYSNCFGMFHRYHVNDLAGFLLDTQEEFDYWRYSAICDGDYIHEETGKCYPDPLNRKPGEYLSERRPASYYEPNRKNKRVWSSMFMGKPTSDEGDFFNVKQFVEIDEETAEKRKKECIAFVRAYDNAATDKAGDHTCGMLGGIRPNGKLTIFDVKLEQVSPEKRIELQLTTAAEDGAHVTIRIPEDPGSAGKYEAWSTKQALEDYTVVSRPVSGSKEMRAFPGAGSVNSGDVEMVEAPWNKQVKGAFRDFPLSDFDDPIDAFSDMHNYLFEIFRKGLVVKNFLETRNLLEWSRFAQRFPVYDREGQIAKIPDHWQISVGVKLQTENSKPSSAVVVARAAENSGLAEALFVVAEYREYDGDIYALFEWIETILEARCANPSADNVQIWLHPDSESHAKTIRQKLRFPVLMFEQDKHAGLTELNWYLQPGEEKSAFNELEKETNLYFLVHDFQIDVATDANGLRAARQEAHTWAFNDKGEPSAVGNVLDCLRMVTYAFKTRAAPLTMTERIEAALKPQNRADAIEAVEDERTKLARLNSRRKEIETVSKQLNRPKTRNPLNKLRKR